ncbi:MAG: type II toxin-antitoxin system VapC family toxin [Candidatus Electryonea clarkiae]|nr:type II toxin-antitoxin system VapC family toxin [Candidatus Electryonea clarkiae]
MIDTNIYSYALKGDDGVVEVLKKSEQIGISVISIGELLSGFKGGGREQKNREELGIFIDSPRVVVHSVDEDTSEFYAEILNNLREIGRPVPTNDIWIAAVAFQNGLKLFTKDIHFKAIAGLSLV